MRTLTLGLCGLALIALAACGAPQQQAQTNADGCTRSVTHNVRFSAPDTTDAQDEDVITARSEGPSCAQGAVLLVMRASNGDLLWTFASSYYDMTQGGIPPEGAPPVTNAQMDTFLAGWANVSMRRSGELPEWPEAAENIGTQGSFGYSSELPRESYEMLRARNLPLLCYAAAAEASQCLVMDPATRSPTMMVAYGP